MHAKIYLIILTKNILSYMHNLYIAVSQTIFKMLLHRDCLSYIISLFFFFYYNLVIMPVNRTSILTWNILTELSAVVNQIKLHSGNVLNK